MLQYHPSLVSVLGIQLHPMPERLDLESPLLLMVAHLICYTASTTQHQLQKIRNQKSKKEIFRHKQTRLLSIYYHSLVQSIERKESKKDIENQKPNQSDDFLIDGLLLLFLMSSKSNPRGEKGFLKGFIGFSQRQRDGEVEKKKTKEAGVGRDENKKSSILLTSLHLRFFLFRFFFSLTPDN